MILIVDDIPENVFSLKKVLEHHGFAVDSAFSGEEALKKILTKSYILVILDVQMPGIDGFEVAENIKGYKKAKDTAIIFLSANSTDTNLIIQGYKQGARDYITKPVDTNVLLLKVKSLYELYESRQATTKQQLEISALYEKEKELNLLLSKKVEILEDSLRLAKIAGWEHNVDTRQTYASPEAYHILNLNPEKDVFNMDLILANLNSDDRQRLMSSNDKSTFEFAHLYTGANGQEKHLKSFIRVDEKDGHKKIKGVVQELGSNSAGL